ncbi:DUF58 domain-containing protein [Klebsiella sp. I138]|uniref:DUF58 domain-containing protein n=1 Tax=Klebsiella sp. I138 TaxID=2755385 RepID=UPI003DA91092
MDAGLRVNRAALLALAHDARLIAAPPGQTPSGPLAGERMAKQQGRGLNFDSLRRYQAGDDVRLIDWQATARQSSTWIRLYNEERERPVFLLVDQRLDMYFATRGQTKSVAAAKTAALLTWHSVHDGDRIGCLVFNDTDMALQKCRPPRGALNAILDDLLIYNRRLPEQYPNEPVTTVSLASALLRASPAIPSGAWVAVLSDFHDIDPRSAALLSGLRRRCEVSAFIVLDEVSQRLPSSGTLTAIYQGNETTFTLSGSLKKAITQRVSAHLTHRERWLTGLGIQVNHLSVAQDLVSQLCRYRNG